MMCLQRAEAGVYYKHCGLLQYLLQVGANAIDAELGVGGEPGTASAG